MHVRSHPQRTCSQWASSYGVTVQGGDLIYFFLSQGQDEIPTLLESLPQLVELEVSKLRIDDSALEPISNLQHLQSCNISSCPKISSQILSGLCSRLTSLTFGPDFPSGPPFVLEDVPEAGWPRLKVFRMFHTPLQPAVLAGMSDLEVLDLWNCALLPSEEVGAAVEQGEWYCSWGPVVLVVRLLSHSVCEDLYEGMQGCNSTSAWTAHCRQADALPSRLARRQ